MTTEGSGAGKQPQLSLQSAFTTHQVEVLGHESQLLSFSYSSEKDTKGFVATIKEIPVHSGGQQQAAVLTGRCCDTFAPLSTTLRVHQLLSIDGLCPKSESASTWLGMQLLSRALHHRALKLYHPSVNPSLSGVLCHRFLK